MINFNKLDKSAEVGCYECSQGMFDSQHSDSIQTVSPKCCTDEDIDKLKKQEK